MARPINEELRRERLVQMDKAAESIYKNGQTVTVTSIAREVGMSSQAIYQSQYMRNHVHQLVEEYKKIRSQKVITFSEAEWEGKYHRLHELYTAKVRECERLKEELRKEKEQHKATNEDLRRLRGTIFLQEINNRI